MWDLPRPGLEPVSPALAGIFLTTALPGKPGISNLTKKTIANLHICFFPMAYFPQPSISRHHSSSCSSPKPTSDALRLFSHLLPRLINSRASSVYPPSISTDTSTRVSFLLSCCSLLTGLSYWTLDCLHICQDDLLKRIQITPLLKTL